MSAILIIMTPKVEMDESMVQIIGYILMFLITSLIGIIIWLAKGVVGKVDHLIEVQSNILTDITEIKGKLAAYDSEINTIKGNRVEVFNRLNKLEKDCAVNAEWIRMKDKS